MQYQIDIDNQLINSFVISGTFAPSILEVKLISRHQHGVHQRLKTQTQHHSRQQEEPQQTTTSGHPEKRRADGDSTNKRRCGVSALYQLPSSVTRVQQTPRLQHQPEISL